jgi:hypothetical protein
VEATVVVITAADISVAAAIMVGISAAVHISAGVDATPSTA